jgi:hypothetical protein
MTTSVSISTKLQKELAHLTRKSSPLGAIRELARKEVLRKQTEYMIIKQQFENKYGSSFKHFEKKAKAHTMDEETEKDYFEWDMSVTVLEDIAEEIKGLQ